MNQLIFLSMLFSITPIPIGLASEPTAFEHTSVISKDELMRFRPANSFRLVYSEDKGVCGTMLNALNEEGYNPQYFNTSPKVKHSLPELLIQTRLNVPRTLLGTHLYRTEEYQIASAVDGKKSFFYRFIGQGFYLFGEGTGVKKGWIEKYHKQYTDFFEFIDKGLPLPDCYFKEINACAGNRLSMIDKRNFWLNSKFIDSQKQGSIEFRRPKWLVNDVVMIDGSYYFISTDIQLANNKTVKVVLSNFFDRENFVNNKGICFFESKFKLTEV